MGSTKNDLLRKRKGSRKKSAPVVEDEDSNEDDEIPNKKLKKKLNPLNQFIDNDSTSEASDTELIIEFHPPKSPASDHARASQDGELASDYARVLQNDEL